METYKQIKGYEHYEVSNCGNVRVLKDSKRLKAGQLLKPVEKKSNGKYVYYYVSLNAPTECKASNFKAHYIHRLVALAFIPNPMQWPEINHIDGNKANNNANNLEWCTHKENVQHSYSVLKREVKKGIESPLYGRKASNLTKAKQSLSKTGMNHPKFKGFYIVHYLKYYSANEAAKATGENAKTIGRKCKKGQKGSEYFFEFVNTALLLV